MWPGGTSLAVQWLRLCLPSQRAQVRSRVREPRSHMLCHQKVDKIRMWSWLGVYPQGQEPGPKSQAGGGGGSKVTVTALNVCRNSHGAASPRGSQPPTESPLRSALGSVTWRSKRHVRIPSRSLPSPCLAPCPASLCREMCSAQVGAVAQWVWARERWQWTHGHGRWRATSLWFWKPQAAGGHTLWQCELA